MKKIWAYFFIFSLLSANFCFGFNTTAETAFVVENSTGDILLSKDINRPIPPASMSKLMTLWMVFEALEAGKISLQDELVVSKKAWGKGGSKMFLRQGEKVSIENLLRGVIIQSGNDACIVLAEGLAGTEENFAQFMTVRAKEIGLNNSTFANSTGWPDPVQKMSSSDILTLATKIRNRFPKFYEIFKETTFTWDGITQKNRNPLLDKNLGADGLKTGYTEEAGYGLVASAKQMDRRISFVITGLESTKQREREAKGITTWAFKNFQLNNLFVANEKILNVPIWLGKKPHVEIASPIDTKFLSRNTDSPLIRAKIVLDNIIVAPIKKGELLKGKLVIETISLSHNNLAVRELEFPLIANETIEKGGLLTVIKTNFLTTRKIIYSFFGVK
jgi:D-alanyl-D-alanine carboxypeptidase (penicillin-binding protein 5/6)